MDHHQKSPPATSMRTSRAASMSRTAMRTMRRARKKRTASAATPKTATMMAISIMIEAGRKGEALPPLSVPKTNGALMLVYGLRLSPFL